MGRDTLVNAVGFQAGWFACVVGAAEGYLWLGPLVALAFLGQHLLRHPKPRSEAGLILASGALGFLLDSGLSASGVFVFLTNAPGDWLSPPWMVALWMNFAATLRGSMGWLRGRTVLAAAFGALGGPLSYLAGARLGAIELAGWGSLAALAAVWGLVVPGLVAFAAAKSEPETA